LILSHYYDKNKLKLLRDRSIFDKNNSNQLFF
jgi:hypothetical protein